ncbi:MAG: polyprenyl synthetase family protein [Pseudonocardiales bacterium]|nr:polyprenyl synthetase family protein [Pseudonocardiales bacterium]
MSSNDIGIGFDDDELETSVRAGVDAVEAALLDAVTAPDEFVSLIAGHLLTAGGKRFRPLLAVLAAHFGDSTAPGVVSSAVVIELTHLATLYHDDVMDEALVRRGAASANARWDNTVAILTGDFLFSRASNVLAELGPEAVKIQAETFERLVIGQIRETVGPQPGEDPVKHYLDVLTGKTGSLISAAAHFGAKFAGADPNTVDVLKRVSEEIGIAFQLSDDIIDIAVDSAESGKTPGTDLREGIPTLPTLYAVRNGQLPDADPDAVRLGELVSAPITDDLLVEEALGLLRKSPALDQARAILYGYADNARSLLAELPDVPARAALNALIEMTVSRTR